VCYAVSPSPGEAPDEQRCGRVQRLKRAVECAEAGEGGGGLVGAPNGRRQVCDASRVCGTFDSFVMKLDDSLEGARVRGHCLEAEGAMRRQRVRLEVQSVLRGRVLAAGGAECALVRV
jgi:hypothetical protein